MRSRVARELGRCRFGHEAHIGGAGENVRAHSAPADDPLAIAEGAEPALGERGGGTRSVRPGRTLVQFVAESRMRVLRVVDRAELGRFLESQGNRDDNLAQLRAHAHVDEVELDECDFVGLVFMQTSAVWLIAPRGVSRRLIEVARRAGVLPQEALALAPNWDLRVCTDKCRDVVRKGNDLGHLFIRESREGEAQHGPWYLQDGSHRALGFALGLLAREWDYVPIRAFRVSGRVAPPTGPAPSRR